MKSISTQQLIFLLSFSLLSCADLKKENEALRNQNQALSSQVDSLVQLQHLFSIQKENEKVSLPNTEVRRVKSSANDQTYTIKIHFPKDYDQEATSYPVLYVTDAETNFGGVSYIVQRLIKDRLIPKILIVGIAYDTDYRNFYRLRSRDLTPVEVNDLVLGGRKIPDPTGGAADFTQFLSEDLFPLIAENYRVKENERALYGHSYGGLFGTYMLVENPDLFNKYLILSPSLWFNNQMYTQSAPALTIKQATRVYMGSGSEEGRIDDLQVQFASLVNQEKPALLQLKSEIHQDETHRTIFGPAFTNGLRYIYDSK